MFREVNYHGKKYVFDGKTYVYKNKNSTKEEKLNILIADNGAVYVKDKIEGWQGYSLLFFDNAKEEVLSLIPETIEVNAESLSFAPNLKKIIFNGITEKIVFNDLPLVRPELIIEYNDNRMHSINTCCNFHIIVAPRLPMEKFATFLYSKTLSSLTVGYILERKRYSVKDAKFYEEYIKKNPMAVIERLRLINRHDIADKIRDGLEIWEEIDTNDNECICKFKLLKDEDRLNIFLKSIAKLSLKDSEKIFDNFDITYMAKSWGCMVKISDLLGLCARIHGVEFMRYMVETDKKVKKNIYPSAFVYLLIFGEERSGCDDLKLEDNTRHIMATFKADNENIYESLVECEKVVGKFSTDFKSEVLEDVVNSGNAELTERLIEDGYRLNDDVVSLAMDNSKRGKSLTNDETYKMECVLKSTDTLHAYGVYAKHKGLKLCAYSKVLDYNKLCELDYFKTFLEYADIKYLKIKKLLEFAINLNRVEVINLAIENGLLDKVALEEFVEYASKLDRVDIVMALICVNNNKKKVDDFSLEVSSNAKDFDYTIDGNSVTINKYLGNDYVVVIPSVIARIRVKEVKIDAIENKNTIAIYIPDGVKCPTQNIIILTRGSKPMAKNSNIDAEILYESTREWYIDNDYIWVKKKDGRAVIIGYLGCMDNFHIPREIAGVKVDKSTPIKPRLLNADTDSIFD